MLPRVFMSLLLPWLGYGITPGLRSGRLLLEAPRRAHYGQWSDLRATSRLHLEPYEPQWSSDELTRSAFRRRLRRYAFERREDMGFAYFVFRASDGAMLGGVTLSGIRRGVTQSASVGYWIGLPYVRQGYASEALRLVLDHAFGPLGLHRVEAACMPRNDASIAVLERAAFRREGIARRYLKINGRWEDHLLYARLAEDAAVRVAPPKAAGKTVAATANQAQSWECCADEQEDDARIERQRAPGQDSAESRAA